MAKFNEAYVLKQNPIYLRRVYMYQVMNVSLLENEKKWKDLLFSVSSRWESPTSDTILIRSIWKDTKVMV